MREKETLGNAVEVRAEIEVIREVEIIMIEGRVAGTDRTVIGGERRGGIESLIIEAMVTSGDDDPFRTHAPYLDYLVNFIFLTVILLRNSFLNFFQVFTSTAAVKLNEIVRIPSIGPAMQCCGTGTTTSLMYFSVV